MEEKSKFTPLPDRRYIVTDQCYWETMTEEERAAYNPFDKKRTPHYLQLVDAETGTIVNLPSGSVIRVVEPRIESKD